MAWFFTAPATRFSNALFFLLPVAACLVLIDLVRYNNDRRKIIFFVCLFFIIINLHHGYRLVNDDFKLNNISLTGIKPIRTVELTSRETDSGLLIWLPTEGDQTWDAPIPATPYFNPALELRVEKDLCGGFKFKQ